MKGIFQVFVLGTIAVVSGCGGGGGGSGGGSSSGGPDGLWHGATDTSRFVSGVVLDDGGYWVLYSQINSPGTIAGVVQGTGNGSGGNFSSSNAKDFNFEGLGILNATVSASYTENQSFDGAVSYSIGGVVNFSTDYDASYDEQPNLSQLAGVYSGSVASSADIGSATVAITSGGVITGSGLSGCTGSGSIAPRPSGNVFDISITFIGIRCENGTVTVTGIAYLNAIDDLLYVAALNGSRTDGFLFVGQTP